MVDVPDPLGATDLDALDAYLVSDDAPENSMGLSDLDGFLTGIVVGPGLALPSEWLPVIWDGKQPQFRSEHEMRTVLGTIMGRYNEIAACFNDDLDEFDPIFWEGPEGDVIVSDWAGGFLDAVALRLEDWKALLDNDDAWKLIVPFLLLNGDVEFDDGSAEQAFFTEAPNLVPVCIRGIREFWRSRSLRPVAVSVTRSRRRTGRARHT
jgi:uncharacterized protein